MSDADQLQSALEKLRRDPFLRGYVTELGELLRSERGFTPRPAFVETYKGIVVKSLHHLVTEHIRPYFTARIGDKAESEVTYPAAILISYNSNVVGIDNRQRRITDWIPDDLSPVTESARVSEHVRGILEREWLRKTSLRPNIVELHLLAQKRISISGSLPVRLPIYISARALTETNNPKSWIRLGENFLMTDEVEDTEKADYEPPLSQGIFFELPLDELGQKRIGSALSKFVSKLEALQVNKHNSYPGRRIPIEDYEAYGGYLKSLLLYSDSSGVMTPLCLSTIAISDELSNVPLGTAMVIAPYDLDHDMAVGISHLCFDLFSAYYKTEQEASLLRETAFLVTAWVHHEAAHWSRYVSTQADHLTDQIEEITGIEEGFADREVPTTENISKRLSSVTAQLSESSEELKAISIIAMLSTELLKQLGGPTTSVIQPAYFTEKITSLLKLYSHVEATLSVRCKRKFPRALLLICCELVRNADKHLSGKGIVTGKIAIDLEDQADTLSLTVTSEPHASQDAAALEALNNLRDSIHSNLDDYMQKEEQLGGLLIHMLADVMGGRAEWSWVEMGQSRIRVKASCKLSAIR